MGRCGAACNRGTYFQGALVQSYTILVYDFISEGKLHGSVDVSYMHTGAKVTMGEANQYDKNLYFESLHALSVSNNIYSQWLL